MKTTAVCARRFAVLLLLAGLCAVAHGGGDARWGGGDGPPRDVLRLPIRVHLVSDLRMEKGGVAMTNWVTPGMIEGTVMLEINRIWKPAGIEWTLAGVSSSVTREENRADVIAYLLQATRDDDGQSDPERIRRLKSIVALDREDRRAVNIHVIPYLGGISQGCALPRQRRVMLGQWTDKPSRGRRPPVKCLLVEAGEFEQGSFSRTLAHELGHILGLKHPERNQQPFHRLMGGRNPGYLLTAEEKAVARKAAESLFSE